MEMAKTVVLMVGLTLLLVFIGGAIGGQSGMIIALVMATLMNFFSYFYSDKLVLKHYHAIEVDERNASGIFEIVKRLCARANIPVPKVYIIKEQAPNAFATGRNPQNAAIAVTEGLLDMLEPNEVEAVIAHELCHVRHYDILIGSIAATAAGAIAIIANIAQFGAMFGQNRNNQNPIILIVASILLPIAASVIQMAISRNREYMADEGAARLTRNPQWLQSALMKLENYSKRVTMQDATPQTAHMFIVNPFAAKNFNFKSLFATHPSTSDRIARLESLKSSIR